jgi:hypothetical protein
MPVGDRDYLYPERRFAKDDHVWKPSEDNPAGPGLVRRKLSGVLADAINRTIQFIQESFRSLSAALFVPIRCRGSFVKSRRVNLYGPHRSREDRRR